MNEELKKAFALVKSVLDDEKNEHFADVKTTLSEMSPSEEINLDKVKTFISETDAGKEYFNNTVNNVKTSSINDFLKSDDYTTRVTTEVSSAVEKREAELRKELGADLSPEQKEIRELKKKQEESERKLLARDIKLDAVKTLRENKLDDKFLPFVVDPMSSENTAANIEKFNKLFSSKLNEQVTTEVEAKFKKIGSDPDRGSNGDNSAGKITQKAVDDARAKADSTHHIDDRTKYSMLKRQYALQQSNND